MAAVDANSNTRHIPPVLGLPEGDAHAMRTSDLLVDLPIEMTDIILSQLSEKDLARVALCSWGWRERSNSDSLWQPLCELRGWLRYGTVVDLNLDDSFLSHSKVLTRSSTETLSPTCEWKAVFLKAMDLERNWAKGRYVRISRPMKRLSSKVQGGLCVCDGSFCVRSYTCRIEIWNLTSQPKDEPSNFETMQHLELKCWWQPEKVLISKGIGLVVGHYKRGHPTFLVRTFDCRSVKWLAAFRCSWMPFAREYRVDGETIIGQCDPRKFNVWSSIDGTQRHTLTGHTSAILDLALRDDMAVSAAENLRLWDVKEGKCMRIFERPDEARFGFSICRLGSKHVMGGYGGSADGMTMRFWDLKSGSSTTIEGAEWPGFNRSLEFNEYAIVQDVLWRRNSTVWNHRGERIINRDFSYLFLGGMRMFRHDRSSLEVWSYDHEQGQFRRLSTSKLLEFKDLEAIWADDTKLVFTAVSQGKRRSIASAFKRLFNRKGDKRPQSPSSGSAADGEEDFSWDFLYVFHFW